MTDSNGRLSFHIPDVQRLPVGLHRFQLLPTVMSDSEDQGVELTLAVVPPNCSVVICSIDGSFAASLSLMGKVLIFCPFLLIFLMLRSNFGFLKLYSIRLGTGSCEHPGAYNLVGSSSGGGGMFTRFALVCFFPVFFPPLSDKLQQ
ncbi:unnamed protein product [Rodentolepis nana]|uniref:Uncharacterized protein n=1 Tax=Rodentolepis nana TaxID=102285 RepID=A0A3P7SY52_RODNA|nr:unnamed protein product [Rodentolepis nana]